MIATRTPSSADPLGAPVDVSPWVDGWPPDTLSPDDPGPCQQCGSLMVWLPVTGPPWRCQRCEPPLMREPPYMRRGLWRLPRRRWGPGVRPPR